MRLLLIEENTNIVGVFKACKGPLDTQRKEMLSFTCRLDPKGYTTTHNVELVLNF